MRKIKFRAYWQNNDTKVISTVENTLEHLKSGLVGIDNHTLVAEVQYTGKKTQKGQEIYEGDIINLDQGHRNDCKPGKCAKHVIDTFNVEWIDATDDIEVCMVGFYLGWQSEIKEVIGNVYENPELLK
jgi:uncharacterized phage protein (TIGR01671 family)